MCCVESQSLKKYNYRYIRKLINDSLIDEPQLFVYLTDDVCELQLVPLYCIVLYLFAQNHIDILHVNNEI